MFFFVFSKFGRGSQKFGRECSITEFFIGEKTDFISISVPFLFSCTQNLGEFHEDLGECVVAMKNIVAVKGLARELYTVYCMRPPSGVRASGNRLFFVCEFVKMRKIVRDFVKMISFVIREKKKYLSRIREN